MVRQSLKQHILAFTDDYIYFSLERIREYLSTQKLAYKENTLKQYLSDLVKQQRIFDAGKRWYTSMQIERRLETASLEDIIQQKQCNY